MKNLFLALLLLFPSATHALSCAFLTPEQAKEAFPVAVHGKVKASEKISSGEETPNSAFLKGMQRVEMDIANAQGVEGNTISFSENLTIYDSVTRFRIGQDYVVFLERIEGGGFRFPVCGYAFSPSQSGVEWEEVRQVMGW